MKIDTDARRVYKDYWDTKTLLREHVKDLYHNVIRSFFPDGLENKKILEIGVGGAGGVILHLRENNQVYALDASASARESCKKFGIDVNIINLDIERFPFEEGVFDFVIALELFEHLSNPQFVIEEVRRVLKDGGKFLVSTPNPLMHHWPRIFYNPLFKKEAFREFLMINMLEILRIYPIGNNLYAKSLKNIFNIHDRNRTSWCWYWFTEKIENTKPDVLFEYGRHFWEQKDKQGFRKRPIEAIDLFRCACGPETEPERKFFLARALAYRAVYEESSEFHELLQYLMEYSVKENHAGYKIDAMYHLLIMNVEMGMLGFNMMEKKHFDAMFGALQQNPDARHYVEEITCLLSQVG